MHALTAALVVLLVLSSGAYASLSRAERLRSARVGPPRPTNKARVDFATFAATTNATATKDDFLVDGSKIPLANFTVQNSYAGRLPISPTESRKLFFWYWPSTAQGGSDSLTIWLNGGPGCSSMIGFLSEHGTFTFYPGTAAPVVNPHAWSTMSDMLYVDQPISTGYSTGTSNVDGEEDIADQFYGFLLQFYAVFPELLSKKLYISGESYAGLYVPYIANRILTASPAEKQATPIDLQSILINDGAWSTFYISEFIPTSAFVTHNQDIFNFPSSYLSDLQAASRTCQWDNVMDQLKYPPSGPFTFDGFTQANADLGNCTDLTSAIQVSDDATDINKCFNIYRITDKCPTPHDPIADYFSVSDLPGDVVVQKKENSSLTHMQRADVQELLHVPGFGKWEDCGGDVFPNGDNSDWSDTLFPSLIASLPRGMTLWHGLDDLILLANGTRITIQMLNWGGSQGFQSEPKEPIMINGQNKGIQHSERGLTYYEVPNAGHMIPSDQPELALEVFKTVLGKGSLLHTTAGGTSNSSKTGSGGSNGTGAAVLGTEISCAVVGLVAFVALFIM